MDCHLELLSWLGARLADRNLSSDDDGADGVLSATRVLNLRSK
jgi:hypothetical protein